MTKTLFFRTNCMGWKTEISLDFITKNSLNDIFLDKVLFVIENITTYAREDDYSRLQRYIAKKIYNYFQKIRTAKKHHSQSEIKHLERIDLKIRVWQNEKEHTEIQETIFKN